MSARIYLGKAGRIFGPYADRDVSEMRATGEIERFSWIWQSSSPGWQAIDPPPPPVVEGVGIGPGKEIEAPLPRTGVVEVYGHAMPPMPRQAPPAPPARKAIKIPAEAVDAVCHDYRQAVAGRLVRVTDAGCELLALGAVASPLFQEHAKVYLNLLNSKTGKTMDIVAMLSGASRTREGWTYRLEWESVPELLQTG
jgi:hypothetical protein